MVWRSRLETSRISCSRRLRSVMLVTLIERPVPMPSSCTSTARFSKYCGSRPARVRLEFVGRGLARVQDMAELRDHRRRAPPRAAAPRSRGRRSPRWRDRAKPRLMKRTLQVRVDQHAAYRRCWPWWCAAAARSAAASPPTRAARSHPASRPRNPAACRRHRTAAARWPRTSGSRRIVDLEAKLGLQYPSLSGTPSSMARLDGRPVLRVHPRP